MIVENIKIYNLKIPFNRTIAHGLHARNVTESIIIVIEDDNGNRGVGEGTPREYVTGETLDKSLVAARSISKEILNQPLATIEELNALLEDIGDSAIAVNHPAAFCAVETALLDLFARLEGKTVWQLFGSQSKKNALTYSGVIPFIKKEQEFLQYVSLVEKLGLTSLKIKVVDLEIGLSQLKIVREILGREIEIRVDVNAVFTAETAIDFIDRAAPINLTALEQPVPKNDLSGLKKVSEHSQIPIIADESMYTRKGPAYLIDNDICRGLNIRLSSCGGFRKAYRIYQQARAKQMMIVLGAHVGETAILSFAGRNLAMMSPDADYLEGSFSSYVIKEDLVDDDISIGSKGMVPIPVDHGLGVDIDRSAIEKWSELDGSLSVSDIHN